MTTKTGKGYERVTITAREFAQRFEIETTAPHAPQDARFARVCLACGLLKPWHAFKFYSNPNGFGCGWVCWACRLEGYGTTASIARRIKYIRRRHGEGVPQGSKADQRWIEHLIVARSVQDEPEDSDDPRVRASIWEGSHFMPHRARIRAIYAEELKAFPMAVLSSVPSGMKLETLRGCVVANSPLRSFQVLRRVVTEWKQQSERERQ